MVVLGLVVQVTSSDNSNSTNLAVVTLVSFLFERFNNTVS